jgi:hypothetical protein
MKRKCRYRAINDGLISATWFYFYECNLPGVESPGCRAQGASRRSSAGGGGSFGLMRNVIGEFTGTSRKADRLAGLLVSRPGRR